MDDVPQSRLDSLSPPPYKGWVERQRAKISKGEQQSRKQLVHSLEKAYEDYISAPAGSVADPIAEMMKELPNLAAGIHAFPPPG